MKIKISIICKIDYFPNFDSFTVFSQKYLKLVKFPYYFNQNYNVLKNYCAIISRYTFKNFVP